MGRPRQLMRALGVLAAVGLFALLLIDVSVRIEVLGHLYADPESAPDAPVALVLGAEVYADGRPSPALSSRLDVGIELLRLGRVRALLMSGGNGTIETDAMRSYAIARGVAADAVHVDTGGERTLASCVGTRDAFPGRIIVVSQEEHLARAVYTCRRIGIDADGVVAPEFTGDRAVVYQLRERVALVFAWLEVNIGAVVGRS